MIHEEYILENKYNFLKNENEDENKIEILFNIFNQKINSFVNNILKKEELKNKKNLNNITKILINSILEDVDEDITFNYNYKKRKKTIIENNYKIKKKCFNIPNEILKNIFKIHINNNSIQVLEHLRLCCKNFREIINNYWIQKIPINKIEEYINKPNNSNKKLEISNFEITFFDKLSPSIEELVIQIKIPSYYYSYIPITVKKINCSSHKLKKEELYKYFKNMDIELMNNFDNKYFDLILIIFVRNSNMEAIKYILQKGCNINKKNSAGMSPLLEACKIQNFEIIDLLIENGANINEKNNEGSDCLYFASISNNLELVIYLVENKNINVNNLNNFGENVLFSLTNEKYFNIIKYLISKNINLNCKDKHGKNILMEMSMENVIPIVEYLINLGMNINEKDNFGWTPLIYTCENQNIDLSKYLIHNGANVNDLDNNNNSPLLISCKYHNKNFIKFLLENGVKVCQKNNFGEDIFDILIKKIKD